MYVYPVGPREVTAGLISLSLGDDNDYLECARDDVRAAAAVARCVSIR